MQQNYVLMSALGCLNITVLLSSEEDVNYFNSVQLQYS